MLQTISKHTQGWIAWVIIAIIAAAFVLWGLEYYISRGSNQQTVVATVNGAEITAQQLNNAYEAFQRNYTQRGMVLNETMQNQLKGAALQQLIIDQVLLQKARAMGFSINPTEAQQVIWHIPDFQEKGQFSPQKFLQALAVSGIDQDIFLDKITNSLIIEQLSSGIEKSNFVTPIELSQAYSLTKQQRDFGYFILPPTAFMAKATPTEAQINTFYQQNKDNFQTPEQVKVAYILLSPDTLKAEIKVNPADVAQFYQDNSSEFAGKTLDQVRPIIEQRLFQQQLSQALAAKSDQLEDIVYSNPSSLNEAAKTLGVPVQTSGFIAREGIKDDPLFSDPKVLTAMFSDEVLKQKNNSQPIELKNGGFIVVRAAQYQPGQIQPLTAVIQQITQQLKKDQGQKEAGFVAYQIQHALESGESIASLAQKHQLKWVEKTGVTREDKTLPQPLLKAAFNVSPAQDPGKKAVTSVLLADGGYAIIQLNRFQNANSTEAAAAEQQKTATQLANRAGELDYQFFLKSAVESAKIKNKI
jgi:peptidyl-prolyl cis-trans isomerase D